MSLKLVNKRSYEDGVPYIFSRKWTTNLLNSCHKLIGRSNQRVLLSAIIYLPVRGGRAVSILTSVKLFLMTHLLLTEPATPHGSKIHPALP